VWIPSSSSSSSPLGLEAVAHSLHFVSSQGNLSIRWVTLTEDHGFSSLITLKCIQRRKCAHAWLLNALDGTLYAAQKREKHVGGKESPLIRCTFLGNQRAHHIPSRVILHRMRESRTDKSFLLLGTKLEKKCNFREGAPEFVPLIFPPNRA